MRTPLTYNKKTLDRKSKEEYNVFANKGLGRKNKETEYYLFGGFTHHKNDYIYVIVLVKYKNIIVAV
ncbi:MAG: hypothetical protein ABH869_01330 [Candidatus Omnitrophota bacterium]